MSGRDQAWDLRLTVGGTVTDCIRASTSHGVTMPIGISRIDLPLPLPSQVDDGASVVVEAALDGSWLDPFFTGVFRNPDRNHSRSGRLATLLCEGSNYRLAYPFESDVVFAGGAKAAPLTLSLGVAYLHVGAQSVAWYGHPTAAGTTVDKTFTPAVNSNFLWVAGRLHGTNSWDASVGDKTIKEHSKIIVFQGGVELGRAFFPESSENWSGMLDYTNDANWSDFELYIACGEGGITTGGGDVTIRFVSGRKPGSSDYDEYEVKAVTYQTAGRTSLRNIARGIYTYYGYVTGTKSVSEITDLDGDIVYLGGNGLVDAGQIRMGALDQPIAFLGRALDLYGFKVFDRGGGIPAVRPFRGVPSGLAVASFDEADGTCWSVRVPDIDPKSVYNAARVDGASGTDSNRKKFAYLYETASPPPNDLIPDPPGVNKKRYSSTFLTSNDKCQQVGKIGEINNSDQTRVEWETWPHAIDPARVVAMTAPIAGYTGNLFLESIDCDFGRDGFRARMAGWKGIATPFTETDDPNEAEVDTTPIAPRPQSGASTEWTSFRPLASVN